MDSWEIQGKLWGAEAEDLAEINESANQPLWEAMISAAKVGKGTRFLDAGCGSGRACVLASNLGAKVTGVDASEALINIARQRFPNDEFSVGNIEDLPYEDNIFDVSFSSHTIYFVDNPGKAVHEMQRVTVPEGQVVIGLWGAAEKCDLARFGRSVWEIIRDSHPDPLPPPRPIFALCVAGELEKLIEQNGLRILDGKDLDQQFEYPDFETFWRGMKASGPFQGLIRLVGEEKVRKAFLKAAEPFQDSKGAIRLKNPVRYIIAGS